MIKKYLLNIQRKIWKIPVFLIILIIPILIFSLPLDANAKGENVTVLKLSKIKSNVYMPFSVTISGNGEKLFYKTYSKTKNNTLEVFVFNLNTWVKTQITKSAKKTDAPDTVSLVSINTNFDGSKIAFASNNIYNPATKNETGGRNIYLYDSATEVIKLISRNEQYCLEPKISDDGEKILFYSEEWFSIDLTDNSTTYYIYDAVSDNLTKIAEPFLRSLHAHALSGDGTKVVYYGKSDTTSETGYPLYELNLYNTTTGKTELLQIKEESNLHLSNMSRDGKYFVFDSSPDVFLCNAETKEFIQATNTPSGESSSPQISADGKRIYFSSSYNFLKSVEKKKKGTQIYMLNTEEKKVYEITKTKPGFFFSLLLSKSVSADGKRITAFSFGSASGKKSKITENYYLIILSNTRNASLKIKSKKKNRDSFSMLIDYDFEDSSFNPLTNDIYAEVGTFTETLKAEKFTVNQKGTIYKYTLPQNKSNGIYKVRMNKNKGTINMRGRNLNLSGTKYTFPVILKSTGLDVDEKLTVEKKKNKNQNNVKKLIFRADRKLGRGTSESVFP